MMPIFGWDNVSAHNATGLASRVRGARRTAEARASLEELGGGAGEIADIVPDIACAARRFRSRPG
jgi:hypothetical protein